MQKLLSRLFLPVLALILGGLYLAEVLRKSEAAAALIKPVYFLLCACFLIIAIQEYLKWKKENKKEDQQSQEQEKVKSRQEIMTILTCAGGIAGYLLCLKYIGFCISTAVFLFLGFTFLKNRDKRISAVVAVALTGLLYAVFSVILSVPLPRGFIGF